MGESYFASDILPEDGSSEQIAPEIMDIEIDEGTAFTLDTSQQIQDATQQLSQIEGLNPQIWATLDTTSRLGVLQNIEDCMASVQGRPSFEIVPANLSPGTYGYYDGNKITVNAADLNDDHMQINEFVDTIVHEGRHVFQDYAIANPSLVSDPATLASWTENMQPMNYLTAEEYGLEAYLHQPVEADAWNYANQVTTALYRKTYESK